LFLIHSSLRKIGTTPDGKDDYGFTEKDWKRCGGRSPHEEFYDERMKVMRAGQNSPSIGKGFWMYFTLPARST